MKISIASPRRFATYKRAHLIFRNEEKLARIVNDEHHPVQFIFAGKAHPNDKAGQDLIRHIIEISRMPEFQGRVMFVEDYDMLLARKLVQGVDVWLNTPTRPLEASGTSGMKAAMNGVLNFSVLDGWWAEGYTTGAGWAMSEKKTYENQQFQDELDAETIYNIIETDIIPRFYERDATDVPAAWLRMVKKAIAAINPGFTMKRMLDQYVENFYMPLAQRSLDIKKDQCSMAAGIVAWKEKIARHWNDINVISVKVPDSTKRALRFEESFKVEVKLNRGELNPADIGIEVVFGQRVNDRMEDILFANPLKFKNDQKGVSTYAAEFEIDHAGVLDYAIRMYPSNPTIPYREETGMVRWI